MLRRISLKIFRCLYLKSYYSYNLKVLILFHTRAWPMRSSQFEHLASFKRYIPNCKCYYVNLGFFNMPFFLNEIKWDLIIYDWSFVGCRFERDLFIMYLNKIQSLKYKNDSIKITFPQDEFTSMDLMCNFINDFNIQYVFSVSPPSEWAKIYKNVDFSRVFFNQVLTGYLEQSIVRKWGNKSKKLNKNIDIGYRTVSTATWGRFNLLKGVLAEKFIDNSRSFNFDIKVGHEFFLTGNKWLNFLSKSRYTLGVEGGSKILDWDGSYMKKVAEFEKENGLISGNEVNSFIPLDREGEINVIAISPRHLEACMTHTVQILIEGDYNDILKPNIHYIPLKADFSNLNLILNSLSDESNRIRISENAYKDIVASGKYTYKSFVLEFLSLINFNDKVKNPISLKDSFYYYINYGCLLFGITLASFYSLLRKLR